MHFLRQAGIAALLVQASAFGSAFTAGTFAVVRDQHTDFTEGATAGADWTSSNGAEQGFTTGITGITAFAAATNGQAAATVSDSKVGNGGASAVLDLAEGILRTGAMAGGASMSASGTLTYDDVLHWVIAGASAQTVTDINFTFAVDGSLQQTADGVAFTSFDAELGSADVSEDMEAAESSILSSFCPGLGSPCIKPSDPCCWVSFNFASNTPALIVFNGVFSLTGASGDLPIHFDLGSSAAVASTGAGSAAADYTNTAQIGLSGPASFSFTSDSGQFLTGASNAVPEPANGVMIAAGLVAIACSRRRAVGVRPKP